MKLEELLKGGIPPEFEWDVVAVPQHGDKMVRLRTLEEALDEWENEWELEHDDERADSLDPALFSTPSANSELTKRFLIQIKPRRQPPAATGISKPCEAGEKHSSHGHAIQEGVYNPTGSLNVDYLMKNAELLFASGEYALARNIYSHIVQAAQSSMVTSQALLLSAQCFEYENQAEAARKNYEDSIAYHPSFEAYQRLSALLLHQKKTYQAAETLERALHLKDISPRIRFELHKAAGNSWMRACEMASAERNYRKALEIEPSADEIQANLGALYLHAEKISEAKRRFEDALAGNPNNDKALSGLGSCSLALGDKKSAHDYFARALQINLHNPQAIFHLVSCAYHLKQYETAAHVLESYVEVAPININLLYSLAGLQFHLGRKEKARQTSDKILELSPTHSGAEDLLKMMGQC